MSTHNSMMALAKEVACQIQGLPSYEEREQVLDKLKEENAQLHNLVRYQLSRLKKAALKKPETTTMAAKEDADYRGLGGTKLLHFDHDGKLYSLEVNGVEYKQFMAEGDLRIEQIAASKDSIRTFIRVFSPKNKKSMLVIVSSNGEKVVFQAPIAVATISSSKEQAGKIHLYDVRLKFIREIVTLNLDGKEPDDAD